MIPNYALIIGAMKSGTTSLFEALARHPQIAASSNKEPGFFAFEEKWALGFNWYERFFTFERTKHDLALEATTDYSKFPFCKEVVERLNASAPRRFKLIYIVRHPLRRIESHARHVEVSRKEVGQCISPRISHSLDLGVSPVALAISSYAQQLDQYKQFFEKGDLFLVTLETLSRRPKEVIRDICKFLGIDERSGLENGVVANSAASKKQLHPLWIEASRLEFLNALAKVVVPKGALKKLKEKSSVPVVTKGRYNLLPEEEEAILADLASDLRRLRDQYHVDIEGEWGIKL